jgi:hypothetical protein
MLVSRDQNAGQNREIKIGNKSFENVLQFKNLGTTVKVKKVKKVKLVASRVVLSSTELVSYVALTGWTLYWRRNVSPVKYELGFYIPEDGIFHSHRC